MAEQVSDIEGINEEFETRSASYDEDGAVNAGIMDGIDQAGIAKGIANTERIKNAGKSSKNASAKRKGRQWSSYKNPSKKEVNMALITTAEKIGQHLEKQDHFNGIRDTADNNDDTALFCRSLIPRMKRLQPRSQAMLRLQIEQLFFQAEFSGIQDTVVSMPHYPLVRYPAQEQYSVFNQQPVCQQQYQCTQKTAEVTEPASFTYFAVLFQYIFYS